jgi:hypothetical protein
MLRLQHQISCFITVVTSQKIIISNGKVLSDGTVKKYASPRTYHSKDMPRLKFSVCRSNTKVKITRSNLLVHKERSCEI